MNGTYVENERAAGLVVGVDPHHGVGLVGEAGWGERLQVDLEVGRVDSDVGRVVAVGAVHHGQQPLNRPDSGTL